VARRPSQSPNDENAIAFQSFRNDGIFNTLSLWPKTAAVGYLLDIGKA
jgi:hypothetical protein